MARFNSTAAFVVAGVRYPAGQTYADTLANALAGDVIWSGMSRATMSPGLVPLDSGAVTIKNSSVYINKTTVIDGANSIEG